MKELISRLPTPRHYQQKGLNLIRQAAHEGFGKILLFMATGGGKSIIFLHLAISGLMKNNYVILVMRRRQLVFQAYKHFKKFGIDASIMMGNDARFDKNKNFQICSIDTISRRDVDFMNESGKRIVRIVDEAHDCTSSTYQVFMNTVKADFDIGLTASPFQVGKKVHDYWDCVVKPIEVHELRDQGFLTDAKIYAPTRFDDSGMKKRAGDYQQKQLSEQMSDMAVVGDVVANYKKYGENKAAIAFCVDKNHSMLVAEMFNKSGIPAVHCDESTKQKDRDKALLDLQTGKIKILCNVNIFSTGVDVPIEVGILARPTASEILYIQQIGRFLRPMRKCGKCKHVYNNTGNCPVCGHDKPSYIKKHAIIIDHGDNVTRHGSPFQIRNAAIDKKEEKKKSESFKSSMKVCNNCFFSYERTLDKCPDCGGQNEKVQKTYKTMKGDLIELNEYTLIMTRYKQLEYTQKSRGFKPNFKYFKLYELFGDVVFDIPELEFPHGIKKIIQIKNSQKNKSGKKIYS